MEIIVSKKALLNELKFLEQAQESYRTIPALSFLKCEAFADGTVKLASTDSYNYLISTIQANVIEPGVEFILLNKLHALLRTFNKGEDEVSISTDMSRLDSGWVVLKYCKSSTRLAGLADKDDFPSQPKMKDESITIPPYILRTLISTTSFAMAGDKESAQILKTSTLEVNQKGVCLAARDRNKYISTRVIDAKYASKETVVKVIPKRAINTIARLIANENQKPVIITDSTNGGFVAIKFDNKEIFSSTVAGRFAIPDHAYYRDHPDFLRVVVTVADLKDAIERAALLAEINEDVDKKQYSTIEIRFSPDNLQVLGNSSSGEHYDPVPVLEFSGKSAAYKFSSRDLVSFLNATLTTKVEIFVPFQERVAEDPSKPVIPHGCVALPLDSGVYCTEFIFDRIRITKKQSEEKVDKEPKVSKRKPVEEEMPY